MKKDGETIGTIMDWHEKTFPDATEKGQHIKWDEEMTEYLAELEKKKKNRNNCALEELADLFIVACGIRRWDSDEFNNRASYINEQAKVRFKGEDLWAAVCKKMAKNRLRVWKKTGDGRFHHEEVAVSQPVETALSWYEEPPEEPSSEMPVTIQVRAPGGEWVELPRRRLQVVNLDDFFERMAIGDL